jgi:hypothetical protein
MEKDSAESVIQYLRSLDLAGHKALGSHLGSLLRVHYPQFNPTEYDCRNLKQFIIRNVPELAVVGLSGGDVLYEKIPGPGSSGDGKSELPSQMATAPELSIWKTFASPSTSYALYANAETGLFRVLSHFAAPLLPPWQRIPSYEADKHRELAREFVAQMSDEDDKRQLTECVNQQVWWPRFYQLTIRLNIVTKWMDFRRKRILEELAATLVKLNIPTAHIPQLTKWPVPDAFPKALRTYPAKSETRDQRLRRVALGVVAKMSQEDLGAIRARLADFINEIDKR